MSMLRRGKVQLVRLVAGIAVASMALPAAAPASADGVFTPTPVVVAKRCSFSGRTPPPGTTVFTHDVLIAINVACNKPVGTVAVFLDGVRRTTEGGGRDVFHASEFFTAPNLASGRHRVQVFVSGGFSTSWTFFVH